MARWERRELVFTFLRRKKKLARYELEVIMPAADQTESRK